VISGTLPHGFSSLVELVLNGWDWDNLPKKDSEIWDALLWTVFLGATVRSAQADYVKEVLGDPLEFKAAHSVNDPNWSKKTVMILDAELHAIGGTPGEGFKRAILQSVILQTKSLDLSRTIFDALTFFKDNKVDVQKIKTLENDSKGSLGLVATAADSIHNVRYIKGILWLYGCGIARDLAPPNDHVLDFLDECGFPGFGWSKNSPEDWQIVTLVCDRMRKVAQQLTESMKQQITPKQAQAAIWYLQTCRGLLPRGHKRQFTPMDLVDFLKGQKWSINQLNERLGDVEELESLAADLRACL
jgi:hypothetical protein